ncbi:acyclic terpene utilization AtuA family protein [Microbacterium rhizosphaerae]|uniref:Acyclic terpene utilization AtuA family protein n=1 Tax=Microbacterium rhizosphaerae TaxID=1678237 RepID=A0ABZ0SM68_9MICO|nr:acyclic terpene utilization AtuA family protein [Microbacterium rhizosphaerae]WPR89361.1 acyclic terpene utilization AtuA family protein [Microbacterium rhizosphaerae]
MTASYRIGAGSGFAGDRIEPAATLAERCDLDALVFECLAERTIGLAHQRMTHEDAAGFDPAFLQRLRAVLPTLPAKTKLLTNAGAADPRGLAREIQRELAEHAHPRSLSIAAVFGDDVIDVLPGSAQILGTDMTVADLGDRIVSANAYIGAAAAVAALDEGADIVVTGRMGDAALFAAPILHHFNADPDSPDAAAAPTLIGHLLECAGQLTGGYFADGIRKTVPDLAHLGFPFAGVESDGSAEFRKPENTGGVLSRETVLEQLLYEIDDPRCYQTPDTTLDFTPVLIQETGPNRVRVSGVRSTGRPQQLKVSIGVMDGYLAAGSIAYAGHAALERAQLALAIVSERWESVHDRPASELRLDLQGANSLRPWTQPPHAPAEVRARIGIRSFDPGVPALLRRELESLYTNGPSGGGGVEFSSSQTVGIVSALIDRDLVQPRFEMMR